MRGVTTRKRQMPARSNLKSKSGKQHARKIQMAEILSSILTTQILGNKFTRKQMAESRKLQISNSLLGKERWTREYQL
jgi:hypothetical protein